MFLHSYPVTIIIAAFLLVLQSLFVSATNDNLPQSVNAALGKLGLAADFKDLNFDLSNTNGISTGCVIAVRHQFTILMP